MTYYPILPWQDLVKMWQQKKIVLPLYPYIGGLESHAFDSVSHYFQPASVDLQIGTWAFEETRSPFSGRLLHSVREHILGVVHHLSTTFLPSKIDFVKEFVQEHQLITQTAICGTGGFVLEPQQIYLFPLDIELTLGSRQYAEFQTRSSAGRNDLFVAIIQDEKPEEWNKTTIGYSGRLWMMVIAQSFPIIIRPGDALAQMRIHEETYRNVFIPDFLEPTHFSINLDPDDSVSLYRSKSYNADPLEFRAKEKYDREEYWYRVGTDSISRSVLLSPGHLYIGRSRETVHVPNDLALDLIARNSRIGEMFIHYAGFLDPGFGMSGSTSVVFEIRVDRPTLMKDGQIIATGMTIPLISPTEKPYTGTYQHQALRLGKQFKP